MESLKSTSIRFLRSSERLFKLDMAYLAKGGAWTTLSFTAGTLASLVTMVAFGNLLSRETYGTYNYLLSLGASLSFLTLSGAGIAVTRAVARGQEGIVPYVLRLQLKYNLIAVATVLSVAAYYGYKGNMLFAASLALLAIAYPMAEAFHVFVQVLTGRRRFDLLAKTVSIITLAATVATLLTLFLTKSVLALIAVYATFSLVPNVIAYLFVTRHLKGEEPDPAELREMRRTAFHITGAGLVGTAAAYIDKILLFQVAGPAALAVYGFAIAGPERLKSLIKNWGAVTFPNLAQRTLPEIRQFIYRRIAFALLVGAALSAAYIVFAPILFKLFLPRYLDAIPYSQVQALGLIFAPVIIYIGSIFAQQNMLRATYALSVGTQIVRIALFVAFGWLWQIWGLIAAYLLASLINALYGILIWEWEIRHLSRIHGHDE
ncbi:oligosaccharide flippase family protein [Candidatus Parcubacteria bacterium]|nr:oligosaccharide flippase family protein [Candidatus Parcubacteria bacterium]